MAGKRKGHWKTEPDEHDFPAAHDFLTLLMPDADAAAVVEALRSADTMHRKAKDLIRASRLPLLPASDAHVAADLKKVGKGTHLSPVLLVRGRAAASVPLVIADGYHRICASYSLDENADIPCRIAELP